MHENLKWYRWNPYTFWNDSRIDELTLEDMAIYRALLDHMWMHKDCCLPDKDEHNARRVRASVKQFRSSKNALFEVELLGMENGCLISPELQKVRAESEKSYQFSSKNK